MSSFFANRKKDLEAATKEAVRTGDPAKLDQLLKHTIAEAEDSSEAAVVEALIRSIRGK